MFLLNGEMHIENAQFQYIARISHGKDSLKMLDVIVSRGLRLDRITTTDVWATDTIRGEYPEMVKFKERADEYIWRKYRIEVEHLCAMKDGEKVTYEKLFYHIPKRKPKNAGGHCQQQGTILGFPTLWGPWCQSDLKRSASRQAAGFSCTSRELVQKTQNRLSTDFQSVSSGFSTSPATRGSTNIVEYLGIAADEPKRFGQLTDRKRAPLVEFGIEEGLCGLYCQYEGILAPSYETSCRDGCWMCHNQGVNQLRLLRRNYPELWALLLKWDTDSPVYFKANGHTVHDYDRRFQMEDERLLIPGDPKFKWAMLDGEYQLKLF